MTHNIPRSTFEEELDSVLSSIQDKFPAQLEELKELLKKKHHDYGSGNLKKRGLLGIQVRLDDKFSRLDVLLKNNGEAHVNDESIEDTWRDIAGYSVMAICLMNDKL
jgi:hypothetical protein